MPGLIPIPLPGMLIRFSSYLFTSALRKYYPTEKLAAMIEIKLSREPSGITINCAELPDIEVWISFKNNSPFHVTVHEFEAEFYLPHRVVNLLKICNRDIGPAAEERLFVQTDLTMKQLEYIKKHKNLHDPGLKINAMLSCRLSTFEIYQREAPAEQMTFIGSTAGGSPTTKVRPFTISEPSMGMFSRTLPVVWSILRRFPESSTPYKTFS